METVKRDFFISYSHDRSADSSFVRSLQHAIAAATRLRYTLAHEEIHQPFPLLPGLNDVGMSGVWKALEWLTGAASVDNQLSAPFTDVLSARALLVQDQHTGPGFGLLREPPIGVALREDALPRVDRTALLRFLDGILTALCLTLILVLAALGRLPDGIKFVLVMLAVCLRYGRREEPDDHAFLSRHRNRKSPGSSLQD